MALPLSEVERTERRRASLARYNNKPERKARMHSYFLENRDKHRESGRRWKKNNRDYANALRRATHSANPEAKNAKSRAIYHRDKNRPENVAKELWAGVLQRARKRGVEVTITREWIIERLQPGVCELSGLPFERGNGQPSPRSPSIDRIDITKGYTPDNSRLIVWGLNAFKGAGDDETMLAIARAYVARQSQ